MKIEGGKIKPCSTCLKTRQRVLDALQGKQAMYRRVQCTGGTFVVKNRTHAVTAATDPQLVGTIVYLSGRVVYNVTTAKQITGLGSVVNVTKTDDGELTPDLA